MFVDCGLTLLHSICYIGRNPHQVVGAVRRFREEPNDDRIRWKGVPTNRVVDGTQDGKDGGKDGGKAEWKSEGTQDGNAEGKSEGNADGNAEGNAEGTREGEWYRQWSQVLGRVVRRKPPLVVGVFLNQSREEVLSVVARTGIDLVQLHGDEGFDACDMVAMDGTPCIRVMHVPPSGVASGVASGLLTIPNGPPCALLLDTKVKGSGGR